MQVPAHQQQLHLVQAGHMRAQAMRQPAPKRALAPTGAPARAAGRLWRAAAGLWLMAARLRHTAAIMDFCAGA